MHPSPPSMNLSITSGELSTHTSPTMPTGLSNSETSAKSLDIETSAKSLDSETPSTHTDDGESFVVLSIGTPSDHSDEEDDEVIIVTEFDKRRKRREYDAPSLKVSRTSTVDEILAGNREHSPSQITPKRKISPSNGCKLHVLFQTANDTLEFQLRSVAQNPGIPEECSMVIPDPISADPADHPVFGAAGSLKMYRAKLQGCNAGDYAPRNVVVKWATMANCKELLGEAQAYNLLFHLQGDVVPTCYGIFSGWIPNKKKTAQPSEILVSCIVLQEWNPIIPENDSDTHVGKVDAVTRVLSCGIEIRGKLVFGHGETGSGNRVVQLVDLSNPWFHLCGCLNGSPYTTMDSCRYCALVDMIERCRPS